jgi:NADPH-dependent 2,4-dienoyl-CoA reductase/sulfur reductase-like enzyme
VIVGGGLVGCEIALDEANHGKTVTVVEALDDIMAAGGAGAPYPNKQMICDLFEAKGVTVMTGTKLTEVTMRAQWLSAPTVRKSSFMRTLWSPLWDSVPF